MSIHVNCKHNIHVINVTRISIQALFFEHPHQNTYVHTHIVINATCNIRV